MVEGLDLFKTHFQEYSNHYILIGGSACDWHLEQVGLPFRATKDLDIIFDCGGFIRRFCKPFLGFYSRR